VAVLCLGQTIAVPKTSCWASSRGPLDPVRNLACPDNGNGLNGPVGTKPLAASSSHNIHDVGNTRSIHQMQ
jgi:hypothetical protein